MRFETGGRTTGLRGGLSEYNEALLIIAGGEYDRLNLWGRTHAFLIPAGSHLPFAPKGPAFRLRQFSHSIKEPLR